MNVDFQVGDTVRFMRNGRKCKGVVRGVQLAIVDTGAEDFVIVKWGKGLIDVKFSELLL